jgi:hypothetical protein
LIKVHEGAASGWPEEGKAQLAELDDLSFSRGVFSGPKPQDRPDTDAHERHQVTSGQGCRTDQVNACCDALKILALANHSPSKSESWFDISSSKELANEINSSRLESFAGTFLC